jgi:uncharacterized protein (DUF58 family)
VAGLGALLLGAAMLFDAEALYVPGLTLLGLVALAAGWVALGAAGSRAARRVDARRVMEDEPLHAQLDVSGGPLGMLGTTLEDPIVGEPRRLPLGRRHQRLRVTARFGRRGRRELAAPVLVIGDPLGLLTLRRPPAQPEASLLVLPRMEPVRAARHAAGEGTGLGGRRTASGAAEVELAGLRPAQAGTSATRIHWPALARGAGLLERRMLPESDARPLVVLDPRGSVELEALDAAVRATASLAVHLARHGGCALLLPGDRRATTLDAELHGWTALHVRLALVEGDAGPPLGALNGRRGPVVLVLARPPERVPRALIAAPATRRVLVVPGTMAGRRASFTVAGCTGYELGRAASGVEAA